MPPIIVLILASWLAGLASLVGGVVAKVVGDDDTEKKREFSHGVVAFGGGILVSAVAFALIPEGMETLPAVHLGIAFCGGGIIVCIADVLISRTGGSKGQFMAMVLDFVPEALALGAMFARPDSSAVLLALFIGAQNLPEGYNAFKEAVSSNVAARQALIAFLLVSFLGPISACAGYLFLQDSEVLTAWIMSAAAGGILYLVFQDVAPKAKMDRHWLPTLGAVLGFAVGMIGEKVLG